MAEYHIKDANSTFFLHFADEVLQGPAPLPFRRTLSLMRDNNCKTIIYTDYNCSLNIEQGEKCGEHYASCINYKETLGNEKHKYSYRLEQKRCFQFFFFDEKLDQLEQVQDLDNMNLLGYIMIHRDVLIVQNGSNNFPAQDLKRRLYAPQCYIKYPIIDGCFAVNTKHFTLTIEHETFKKSFQIESHYFSQQNHITNTCTHAALKTALKCRNPNLTAEDINSFAGINHIEKLGNSGLKPNEYRIAIDNLSQHKLSTYVLKAKDMHSNLEFWQTIYVAIESRYPVILLFDLPWEKDSESGHAVTIIGHTLNKHNWWSYGLKGRTGLNIKDLNYLSSILWCNNFIIQDDRMGPYYLLPKCFLSYSKGTPSINGKLRSKWSNFWSFLSREDGTQDDFLYNPLYGIIITPDLDIWENILDVEPFAFLWLKRLIKRLEDEKIIKDENEDSFEPYKINIFNDYFYKYYRDEALIFRTLLVKKDDYIDAIEDQESIKEYKDKIVSVLPDYFMVTEISIPELFWINKKKVGEIIISLDIIKKNIKERDSSVLLLRLPRIIGFPTINSKLNIIQQSRFHYDMISPKGICI